MVLLARTTPLEDVKKKSEGLSLFYIDFDKTSPHVELKKIKKMGGRGVDANEVFFDGYRIPANTLIGKEGEGFKIVSKLQDRYDELLTDLYPGFAWNECREVLTGRGGAWSRIRRSETS